MVGMFEGGNGGLKIGPVWVRRAGVFIVSYRLAYRRLSVCCRERYLNVLDSGFRCMTSGHTGSMTAPVTGSCGDPACTARVPNLRRGRCVLPGDCVASGVIVIVRS